MKQRKLYLLTLCLMMVGVLWMNAAAQTVGNENVTGEGTADDFTIADENGVTGSITVNGCVIRGMKDAEYIMILLCLRSPM